MKLNMRLVLNKYSKYFLLVYCTLLLVMISIPFGTVSSISFFDKIEHFLVFILYGFLYASAFDDVVLGLGFPLYTELFQLFVPWRTFELLDLGTNVFSTLLGILISRLVLKKEPSFP